MDVGVSRVGDGCCVKNEEKCWEEFVGIRYAVHGLLGRNLLELDAPSSDYYYLIFITNSPFSSHK